MRRKEWVWYRVHSVSFTLIWRSRNTHRANRKILFIITVAEDQLGKRLKIYQLMIREIVEKSNTRKVSGKDLITITQSLKQYATSILTFCLQCTISEFTFQKSGMNQRSFFWISQKESFTSPAVLKFRNRNGTNQFYLHCTEVSTTSFSCIRALTKMQLVIEIMLALRIEISGWKWSESIVFQFYRILYAFPIRVPAPLWNTKWGWASFKFLIQNGFNKFYFNHIGLCLHFKSGCPLLLQYIQESAGMGATLPNKNLRT